MEITVTKTNEETGETKDFVFKYSNGTVQAGSLNKPSTLTVHKFICKDLKEPDNEVFFMSDPENRDQKSIEDMLPILQKQAEALVG
nr:hypothetical protein [uncultured Flavobacterium sp.]